MRLLFFVFLSACKLLTVVSGTLTDAAYGYGECNGIFGPGPGIDTGGDPHQVLSLCKELSSFYKSDPSNNAAFPLIICYQECYVDSIYAPHPHTSESRRLCDEVLSKSRDYGQAGCNQLFCSLYAGWAYLYSNDYEGMPNPCIPNTDIIPIVSTLPSSAVAADTRMHTNPLIASHVSGYLRTQNHPMATSWTPKVSDTWHWQISGDLNTEYPVVVYDVDLFDTPTGIIADLHAQGKYVVCYFSAGSSENWRPDYSKFRKADEGNSLNGWAGAKWVDTRSVTVREIMTARLDLAKSKGCDGVEADNVDGYINSPGFPLTATTQLDYNTALAEEAHARGLKIGLKNNVDQLSALQPFFDFAVSEQCHRYNECVEYSVFTRAGKPVFNAEYSSEWEPPPARAQLCAQSLAANIRTLVLPKSLDDEFRYSCD